MNQWKGLSLRYVSEVDFEATSEDEISIKAAERFQLLWVSGDRWLVTKVDDDGEDVKKTGYVPAVSLVKEKSVEEQPWYLDVDVKEAEKLLLTAPNKVGSFVVRPSQGNILGYALSVRRKDDGVIHYHIKRDQEQQFFIGGLTSFLCVHDLVLFLRKVWIVNDWFRMIPYIKDTTIEDSWEKPWSDFSLMKKLNSKAISSLFEGKWIERKKRVLIQSIDQELFVQQQYMNGIEILKRLNHKNIITLYALCTSENPIYIVTEFLAKGDLKSFLQGEEGPLLTDPQLMYIASQVADGLAYLEVKHVAHCSLGCCHVIVGNNLICKISYFGYARMIKNPETFITIHGKQLVKWLPPEYIYYGELSAKTCVWSFGILLYEMFTLGQSPYAGLKCTDVLKKLEAGYRLPMPPLCSSHVYSLMLKCWDMKPNKRPSFQKITEMKIFPHLALE